MSIDLEQFHRIFFEESFEGLDTMESGLLELEPGAADVETVNDIFRAAHSIKGGSGTFGFGQISEFTHLLETLLDEMRDGNRPVTRDAVDALLSSVDIVRDMLTAARDGGEPDAGRIAEVQGRLTALLDSGAGPAPAGADADESVPAANDAGGGWRVSFAPVPGILLTGNDPLRLLRELEEYGDLEVRADLSQLPPLAELNPESLHLSWEVELIAGVERAQVEEVFEWVEDDCELVVEPLAADPAPAPQAQEPAAEEAPAPAAAPAPAPAAAEAPAKRRAASQDAGSIRVSTARIDELIDKVGELVITQSMLGQVGEEFDLSKLARLRDGLAQLERNTRDLQSSVMQIRMLPIGFSFNRFTRLVHDLSGKLGKQVELEIVGEQTELDKTVLEKIGDPLVHLVRNSLDHGIELPEARRAAGKPETGRLRLEAFHQGGNIIIRVEDDGAGLDAEKLLARARQRGLVGDNEELTEDQIYNLIFAPGFSTAEKVSDVSGRGVGMDVVRRNIKDLGGTVEIGSQLGKGSTITVRLPLTLAILDGQLVRVGREIYIIPLVSIIESLQVDGEAVRVIAGHNELYKLREEYIPIIRLHEAFGIEPDNRALEKGLLVVVEGDGQRAGVFVDDLLAQQQVVIKSLETNFGRVEALSGATILGDGTVAMIMDVSGLVALARDGSPAGGPSGPGENVAHTQDQAA